MPRSQAADGSWAGVTTTFVMKVFVGLGVGLATALSIIHLVPQEEPTHAGAASADCCAVTGTSTLQLRSNTVGQVRVRLADGQGFDETVTADAAGGWAFAGVPGGSYTVTAAALGYLSSQGTVEVIDQDVGMPPNELRAGDLNGDGFVNLHDIAGAASNFGRRFVSLGPGPVAFEPALGGIVFDQPTELGAYPGGRVFGAEQNGEVLLVSLDGATRSTLLKIDVRRSGLEDGLLSVALDPSFGESGHLWVYYSPSSGEQRTRLSRFTVDGDQANLSTELVVLDVPQPFSNHNGGAIRFGPDGMLYLGLRDGGGGGPLGNSQNTQTLLGSIIRIDVRQAEPGQPYVIPTGNPFVGGAGLPEIWAYGLRNPWRMAFDPITGTLWAGDVGQNAVEEVDIIRLGGNYGWNPLEGDRCFSPPGGCDPTGTVPPIAVYDHGDGRAVTGGVVYRGSRVPRLTGFYLYSDFSSGNLWAIDAGDPSSSTLLAQALGNVSSFGTDAAGEVYLLRFGASALRIVSGG